MMGICELTDHAKSAEVQKVIWDTKDSPAKECISIVSKLSPDTKAAYQIIKNNFHCTPVHGWLVKTLEKDELDPDLIEYLKCLEVPHFNIYDMLITADSRIIDAVISITTLLWIARKPIPDELLYFAEFVASRMESIDSHKNSSGLNALQNAINGGDIAMSRVLLEAGANPKLKYKDKNCEELALQADRELRPGFYAEYIAIKNAIALNKTVPHLATKPRLKL